MPAGLANAPWICGASVRAADHAHRGGKHDAIHQDVGCRRSGGRTGPCRGACERLVGKWLWWSVGRWSLVRARIRLSLLRWVSVLRRLSRLGRLPRLGGIPGLRLSGLGSSAMAWPAAGPETIRLRLIVEPRSVDQTRAVPYRPHGFISHLALGIDSVHRKPLHAHECEVTRVGCREAQPNRTDTTPALARRLRGLERCNSPRSLTPYTHAFHVPGCRVLAA